jgi:hypothetical protein
VLLVGLVALGCASAQVHPEARSYADALAQGDLHAAYAATSARYRSQVTETAFRAAHPDAAAQKAQAARVLAAQAQLDVVAPELSEAPVTRIAAARAALAAFLDAAEARRFTAAYGWLSSALRGRYTPSSLAHDFSLAPDAGDRLRRARAALGGPVLETGATVRFPLAEGRAVELVEEADGFRVASLE